VERWFQVQVTRFAGDGPLRVVVAHHNITERKLLEREVLEISAREQRRLGQELHDDICQRMVGTQMLSTVLTRTLATSDPASAGLARQISTHIGQAQARIRMLARGLTPMVFEVGGLVSALRELAVYAAEIFRIDCTCECAEGLNVSDEASALHLYRIAQEAITNAVRHGRATTVVIGLHHDGDHAVLCVRDNGCGLPLSFEQGRGMGVRTMRYRAGILGAVLVICSGAERGAEVRCTFATDFTAAL
jgi:signal transduction histidine kinase